MADPTARRAPDPEPAPGEADAPFDWSAYVAFVISREGSLTAAAEKLAAARAYEDDVGSVERALRRLRHKGTTDGGRWGRRALAIFGMPDEVLRRLRWMGAYHSRFTDLPVPIAADLVRAWDRPPVNGSRHARAWLGLAQASVALRRADLDSAVAHVERVRGDLGLAPANARIEAWLVLAYVASRRTPEAVPALLRDASALLASVDDDEDRACLCARIIDHRGYAAARSQPADHAAAEALYAEIDERGAPPFVRARRASGLAHARWKLGRREEAIALAREAVREAGDGGHVRLRAMALSLLARISDGEESTKAHARAVAISTRLDDETLRLRLSHVGVR